MIVRPAEWIVEKQETLRSTKNAKTKKQNRDYAKVYEVEESA